ncbi:hypothetical protein [Actinomadura sp. B10D3]|uniref:hypothetical protein n=1 Tax=Actinomadura sp. B10D3 TaxID=3153557 RepID=UPI00325DD8BD
MPQDGARRDGGGRFLASVAREAERLRRAHSGIGISVGCELTIFMSGLVPGEDWMERGAGTPPRPSQGRPLRPGRYRRHRTVIGAL